MSFSISHFFCLLLLISCFLPFWIQCAPPEWICDAGFYGVSDGCDCECGAIDPDCLVEYFAIYGCEEETLNYRCNEETATCEHWWKCDLSYHDNGDGVCDCGCGSYDPDCDSFDSVRGCAINVFEDPLSPCNKTTGECVYSTADWTCDIDNFNSGDGCHCECGLYDPDCEDITQDIYNCPEKDGKLPIGCSKEVAECVYQDWTCDESFYNNEDGCNCGCGAFDPDCLDGSQEIIGCPEKNYKVVSGCSPYTGECIYVDWVCDKDKYGAGDGCDCECGSVDPDCFIEHADIIGCPGTWDVCNIVTGVCDYNRYSDNGYYNADGDCDCIDSVDVDCVSKNWNNIYDGSDWVPDAGNHRVCKPDSEGQGIFSEDEWSCSVYEYWHRDGCHCECGIRDPDCDDLTSKVVNCGDGLWDCVDLRCIPYEWTCDPGEYNKGDGHCDCDCGSWDPDCVNATSSTCDSETEFCSDISGRCTPNDWTCSVNKYNAGDGICDCECGVQDKDCLGEYTSIGGCLETEVCFMNFTCVDECSFELYNNSDGNCQCLKCQGQSGWGNLFDPDCVDSSTNTQLYSDCGEGLKCMSDNNYDNPLCLPKNWEQENANCLPSSYNSSDGICNCNCGTATYDPNCYSQNETSSAAIGCEDPLEPYCRSFDGLCHNCGDFNMDNNDGCHCGCGSWDSDCLTNHTNQVILGCSNELLEESSSYGCYFPGICQDIPTWSCWPGSYGSGDSCDCGCGKWDPDCDDILDSYKNATGCETNEICENLGGFSRCVPEEWTCSKKSYGGRDGCQCNCGIQDLDCEDDNQTVEGCLGGETCIDGICETIFPAPVAWECEESIYFAGDFCDCECGSFDPDCNNQTLELKNCEPEQYCGYTGHCLDFGEDPFPHGWHCDESKYNDGETCDCECGGWDPDCLVDGNEISGCTDFQICEKVYTNPDDPSESKGLCVNILPGEWICHIEVYRSNDGCHCGCGTYDPDCDDLDAIVYNCPYEYSGCDLNGECSCKENYFGDECEVTTCDSFYSNDSLNVCSGYGDCWPYEKCNCSNSGDYFGDYCQFTSCDRILSNFTDLVCSGHGTCFPKDKCNCFENYNYNPSNCNITTCNGILSNDNNNNNLCFGHGNCVNYDDCECFKDEDENEYFGIFCNITKCYDIWNNDSSVCSNHGDCFPFNNCTCEEGYFGEKCEEFNCYDIHYQSTSSDDESGLSLCNSHGTCIEHDNCDCDDGYFDNNHDDYKNYLLEYENVVYDIDIHFIPCSIYKCFGSWNFERSKVCNFGNGSCINPNNCSCNTNNGYYGKTCDQFLCFGINSTSNPSIVCSGHGKCVKGNTCNCNENKYTGNDCQVHKCFGVSSQDKENVCSGNGDCLEVDICECDDYYDEELDCSKEAANYLLLIGAPLGVSLGTLSLCAVVLVAICGCCFCCCFFGVLIIVCCMKRDDWFGEKDDDDSDDSDDSDDNLFEDEYYNDINDDKDASGDEEEEDEDIDDIQNREVKLNLSDVNIALGD